MTFHVAVGTTVIAAQFPYPSSPASTDPAVLAPGVSPMSIVCRPGGTACSEPPRTFTARVRGTAEITAARATCGTAQRCVTPMGVPVAGFEVTVVVD